MTNSATPPAKPAKDMSGYIARNAKRTSDKQPAWRGKVRINGKEYLLSLWEKDSEVMNLSVTDPDTMPQRSTEQSNNNTSTAESDPFGDLFGSLPGGN